MKTRKEITINKLKGLGQTIVEDVTQNKVPSLNVPSRGTSNIVYDEDKRHYVLGERYGKRSLGNVKQIKKIGQMVYMANFCKQLVEREKTATLRELYYVSEGWDVEFGTQDESNIVGEDLEVTLGMTRED
ncbi:MAG: DNA topoisomerase VI, partial [Methanobacteriaceae archaeon]|nr:DNA topoisomerase VI [Methanobacteriaceae archaeon]